MWVRGTVQADSLSGSPEDDIIFGLMGNDIIAGNAGSDSIFGGKDSDLIDGNSGRDSLFGDLGSDTVSGGEDNDFVFGGKDNDLIFGNSGNDVLSGDRGADILAGGDGGDVFVLSRYAAAEPFRTSGGASLGNADTIADFADRTDVIGLAGGLNFSDLNILDAGNDTVIQDRVTGEFLAILRGVNRNAIDQTDFTTNISSIVPNPPPPARTTAYALTPDNRIVGFSLSNPQSVITDFPVTGLQAGESLLGIDYRPANGVLYGVGSSNRLYTVNARTGEASQVGSGQFAVPLTPGAVGFDFNPTVDRIRFVNQAGQNGRLNPDTGSIVDADTLAAGVQLDGNLAYRAGDRNFGSSPAAVGAAYVNNFAGGTSTTLFVIDSNSDVLVRQDPPNNGVLNSIGSLGVDATSVLGFDIRSIGGREVAVAALEVGGVSGLYNINLTTGQASFAGQIAGGRQINGLALPLPTAYALTVRNGAETIVGFNEAAPRAILSDTAVTGLQPGESLLGIDFRPANGLLYGLGSSNRLYAIDPVTGAASQVGSGQFAVPLTPGAVGFDFNPTVDRIRLVNQAGQNVRLNPDTGAIVDSDTLTGGVQLDGNLAYRAGDPNVGNPTAAVGAGYVNNFAGATSTTLFVIDSNLDVLVRQDPPNNGVLNTIGPLGVDASSVLGFDIRSVGGNETALAAIDVGGVSSLYNINLTTGRASIVGQIGDGRSSIKGLALTLI
ncbi:MAG: DUF4394 domain-containing protein [Microcoleus sp. PH2017_22_RUC_O_B]|uniref:DUF4394 domain-containing protein n=1 Tax=unclassified Microcoleus TaxID=2642155 RepID=UPI001D4469FC|nr:MULTISPECIES: DUF4394 domain-containing protein [unclassified Microcoleus]MCC3530812.1 DUF4394 domain-containing protein [Microcoleus sp. PH2017_21_RUC_O_A]MCC3543144.1 DUF4394 domain-containing protein [Microcoleus sp. PH2017_22_RUC_O_B]